jgi:hypothetical protein
MLMLLMKEQRRREMMMRDERHPSSIHNSGEAHSGTAQDNPFNTYTRMVHSLQGVAHNTDASSGRALGARGSAEHRSYILTSQRVRRVTSYGTNLKLVIMGFTGYVSGDQHLLRKLPGESTDKSS